MYQCLGVEELRFDVFEVLFEYLDSLGFFVDFFCEFFGQAALL